MLEERNLYIKLQQDFEAFKAKHQKCAEPPPSPKPPVPAVSTIKLEAEIEKMQGLLIEKELEMASRDKAYEELLDKYKMIKEKFDKKFISTQSPKRERVRKSQTHNKKLRRKAVDPVGGMVVEAASSGQSDSDADSLSSLAMMKLNGALECENSSEVNEPQSELSEMDKEVLSNDSNEGGPAPLETSAPAERKDIPPAERKKFFSTSISDGSMKVASKPLFASRPPQKKVEKVENDMVMFSKNFQMQMKGGTMDKIIERCTSESNPENSFVDTFLLTYRTFISSSDLLEKLLNRYNVGESPGLEAEEKESRKIIRLRVANFIKRWLTQHFHDFDDNPAALNRMREIVDQTYLVADPSLGRSIIAMMDNEKSKKVEREMCLDEAPKPLMPKGDTFDDFEALELARQLCLYEQSIFRSIHMKECLNQGWNSKTNEKKMELSPNVTRMIRHFNDVSFWVSQTILQQKKVEGRFKVMKKFIKVIKFSREFNNFNLIQEVLAAFGGAAVFRLKKTWQRLEKEKKWFDEYLNLKAMMAQDGNFKVFRNVLKVSNPPCLPYLGIFLTDLTFIEDGNPNILPVEGGRDDIINFEKMRKVSVVIEKILLYQQQLYNFAKVDPIYKFVEALNQNYGKMTEAELYKLSLEAEPRDG
uniref:Ras-GEF domain-containing protein n=1 Tax=Arcella intermedia TaxID=1963864 RepID=A0A6B2KZM1_9EUKA